MGFVDVKNDVAIHKIFGNRHKSGALLSLVNALMGLEGLERVVDVAIEARHLYPPVPEGKSSIMVIQSTDQEGRETVLELLIGDRLGFEKRFQYYDSARYVAQVQQGDKCPWPRKFLCILDDAPTDGEGYVSTFHSNVKDAGNCLLNGVTYHFIELPKFKKTAEQAINLVDRWIYFIKNAENLEVIPDNVDDEGLRTAYHAAERHSWSKAALNLYNDSKVQETDILQRELFLIEKQMEMGYERGRKMGELKMILAMHRSGINIPQIAAISHRTEEEVLAIIEKEG